MLTRTLSVALLSILKLAGSTLVSVCDKQTRYEYDIDECPGGIQIRDVGRWFSKSREKKCICGEVSMLQFDGREDWDSHNVYLPPGTPHEFIATLGVWQEYSLAPTCELLKGNDSSALFINAKKYENPSNLPTRAIELNLEKYEINRLAGHFKISMDSGHNHRHNVRLWKLPQNVILNTNEPVLIVEDPDADFKEHLCAYDPSSPKVVLTRYISTTWGNQDLATNCESKLYKPYKMPKYMCPVKCENFKKFEPPPSNKTPGADAPVLAFRQIMLNMVEIAIRMRYAEKFVVFQYEDHPYAAILQNSCRVFFRAFPSVVQWETLMNAVTLFGVAFEGLVPSHMDKDAFDQMKIILGRCTLQQGRRQKELGELLKEICPEVKEAVEQALNSSIADVNLKSDSSNGTGGEGPQKIRVTFGGPHNVVVELLWKVVQFAHASCMSSSDHYPNIFHAYTNAMMELFSAPVVQLLWYQQGKYDYRQLGKAMVHIFPELSDHVLPMMDLIFKKLKFQTHFNILQRPTIPDLDGRDMRCAGYGKLIWGGKACCYGRSDDNKFYFFNKVAYAKL